MKPFPSLSVLILLASMTFVPEAVAAKVEHHGLQVEEEQTSRECIMCHDGSQAHAVSYCTVQCDFRTPHVIEKRYPPRRKMDAFASLSEVRAKGVKIVDGKVTCISCHNLRNPGKFHLVLDEKHRLCSICHIKEAAQFRMKPPPPPRR